MSFIRTLIIFITTLSASLSQAQSEFKPGRYVGFLKLDAQERKIAVIADVLIESPDDLKGFPKLTAIVRLSLGGYKSHEYITEVFKNLRYDFDTGNLTFDEPGNDLLITSSIQKERSLTKLTGRVFVRSVVAGGTIELVEVSNEPDDEEDAGQPPKDGDGSNFIPTLDGQYEGLCGRNQAALQVQTMRGMIDTDSERKPGSHLDRQYGIGGRLAFKNDKLCGNLSGGRWCTRYHFSKGAYNFYRGNLTLVSDLTTAECKMSGGDAVCELHAFDGPLSCTLKKVGGDIRAPEFFTRKYNLQPTAAQMELLPDPQPPANEALAATLSGSFFGYAHNEFNDSYLPLQLYVAPYSSTDNPHNPNQIMISSTASIYFGGPGSDTFTTQRFEARSFYLRPGFILSGANADSFIEIVDWKAGFIRGILFSHNFGKVGTVQLVKGAWPQIPEGAGLVPGFAGEFKQPFTPSIVHWIRFNFPPQPDAMRDNVVPVAGSFQSIWRNSPVIGLDRGSFDPYTLRINWQFSKDDVFSYGTGELDPAGQARLFWPPSPIFGAATNSYIFERFERSK